jgi:hypothetical protein
MWSPAPGKHEAHAYLQRNCECPSPRHRRGLYNGNRAHRLKKESLHHANTNEMPGKVTVFCQYHRRHTGCSVGISHWENSSVPLIHEPWCVSQVHELDYTRKCQPCLSLSFLQQRILKGAYGEQVEMMVVLVGCGARSRPPLTGAR